MNNIIFRHAITTFQILFIVILFFISSFFIFAPAETNAMAPSGNHGWLTRSDSHYGFFGCGDNNVREAFNFRDAQSGAYIVPTGIVLQSYNLSTGVVATTAPTTAYGVRPICYDPTTEGLALTVDGGSDYYNFSQNLVWGDPASPLRNDLIQSTVWLRHVATSTEYAHNYPLNTSVNFLPEYRIDLNYIPSLDGATGVSNAQLYVVSYNATTSSLGTTVYSGSVPVSPSNGLGVKTILPKNLSEGYYAWGYYLNLNGGHEIERLVTGQAETTKKLASSDAVVHTDKDTESVFSKITSEGDYVLGEYTNVNEQAPGGSDAIIDSPSSSFSGFNWPFLYDVTAPVITAVSHFPVNTNTVTISASSTDVLSGIRHIRLYVDDSPVQTCQFAGSQSATCNGTVVSSSDPGTTHTYYAEISDMAGNIIIGTTQNFTINGDVTNLVASSTSPLDASLYKSGSINFTGTVQNIDSTNIAEGGNAGLDIDWNFSFGGGFNVDEYFAIPDNSTTLGAFIAGETKQLSYLVSDVPVGSHAYRFNVAANSVYGSTSSWRTITVISGELNASSYSIQGGESVNFDWTVQSPIDVSCEISNLGVTWTGASTNGNADSPELTSDTTFVLSCNGVALDLAIIEVNTTPELTIFPRIVPKDGAATLLWNTRNGDESQCTLKNGPSAEDLIPALVGGDPNAGFAPITVTGRSRYTLSCPGGSTMYEVEIVPSAFES